MSHRTLLYWEPQKPELSQPTWSAGQTQPPQRILDRPRTPQLRIRGSPDAKNNDKYCRKEFFRLKAVYKRFAEASEYDADLMGELTTEIMEDLVEIEREGWGGVYGTEEVGVDGYGHMGVDNGSGQEALERDDSEMTDAGDLGEGNQTPRQGESGVGGAQSSATHPAGYPASAVATPSWSPLTPAQANFGAPRQGALNTTQSPGPFGGTSFFNTTQASYPAYEATQTTPTSRAGSSSSSTITPAQDTPQASATTNMTHNNLITPPYLTGHHVQIYHAITSTLTDSTLTESGKITWHAVLEHKDMNQLHPELVAVYKLLVAQPGKVRMAYVKRKMEEYEKMRGEVEGSVEACFTKVERG